ncbi:hypothetical protein MFIFM68171_09400 [Madurella fahalii]|uniref:Protein kinase domain-containing protein n=1 Tax=Madurella fahalii TaxID=1157608 RepID=A0ABQ0GN61_9PEZI
MSSVFTPTSASAIGQQPLPMGLQLKSSLDKCYVIDEVLSERSAAGRICFPERHILVFPYLEKGLLHVDTAALSSVAKKVIIRDVLAGLADLHDKHIIHTDIKPTNIMMDSFKQHDGNLGWCNVQITDLEAAVVLPPKAKGLTDRLSGNHFWRSPEAWAREFRTPHQTSIPLPSWQYSRGQGGWDLVCKMTCMDPSRRITARKALQHPWFAGD